MVGMNAISNEVAFSCEVAYLFSMKCLFPIKWPNSRILNKAPQPNKAQLIKYVT